MNENSTRANVYPKRIPTLRVGIKNESGSWRLLPYIALLVVFPCVLEAQETVLSQSTVSTSKRPKAASVAATDGPVIPGLLETAIPQGIAFAVVEKKILISHYFVDSPSCVSVLNSTTGEMTACVTLQNANARPHRGHVGGITAIGDSLFVASDGLVLQYKLSDFLAMQTPPAASAIASRKCKTKASFCSTTAELLLVGEFAYRSKFPTKASHRQKDRKGVRKYAWVCGYAVNDPLGKPTCILSIRQRVQGMCVAGDRVYLSVSYGRTNRSRIVVYRNPIGKEAHEAVEIEEGERIPLWFLDGENYLGEIDFPPMSEGIVMIEDKLAVLSESGATKYRFGGKGPIDRLKLLDVSKFK